MVKKIILAIACVIVGTGTAAYFNTSSKMRVGETAPVIEELKPSATATPKMSHYDEQKRFAFTKDIAELKESEAMIIQIAESVSWGRAACQAYRLYDQALLLNKQRNDTHGEELREIISLQAMSDLTDQQLILLGKTVIQAAQEKDRRTVCSGRLPADKKDVEQTLEMSDMLWRVNSELVCRNIAIKRLGVTAIQIRNIALTSAQKEVIEIQALLADRSNDAAREQWRDYRNLWQFTQKELGFTADEITELNAAG